MKSPTEIEEAVSNFNDNLKEVVRFATPVMQFKNTSRNNTLDEIKKLILTKKKARVKWQQTHYPPDKTVLNRATNKLNERSK